MSEAQHKSQGIVGLSLMVQIGETPNPELRIITSTFNKVLYRGELYDTNADSIGTIYCWWIYLRLCIWKLT